MFQGLSVLHGRRACKQRCTDHTLPATPNPPNRTGANAHAAVGDPSGRTDSIHRIPAVQRMSLRGHRSPLPVPCPRCGRDCAKPATMARSNRNRVLFQQSHTVTRPRVTPSPRWPIGQCVPACYLGLAADSRRGALRFRASIRSTARVRRARQVAGRRSVGTTGSFVREHRRCQSTSMMRSRSRRRAGSRSQMGHG